MCKFLIMYHQTKCVSYKISTENTHRITRDASRSVLGDMLMEGAANMLKIRPKCSCNASRQNGSWLANDYFLLAYVPRIAKQSKDLKQKHAASMEAYSAKTLTASRKNSIHEASLGDLNWHVTCIPHDWRIHFAPHNGPRCASAYGRPVATTTLKSSQTANFLRWPPASPR